ncbi:MAG: DMT family transporter [Alphaproteobacteria bacterium]|uniref:DMT family transporter n=1 Tax=Candidatus Nitrobium versatile TaxID=2884831 RepID=A0A953JCX3_9BACT|nr:DMT family transporter [Candidatus Nitrobium versatile]
MSKIFLFLFMFCAGIAAAVQPSINGRLARKVGVIESSFISFTVGAAVLLALVLLAGRGGLKGIGEATWWELTGGVLGAFFVSMSIVAVPRIGTAATMAAVIAGQLITGLLIDHFGLFGFRPLPFDAKRAAGAVLLFAGAFLIFKR